VSPVVTLPTTCAPLDGVTTRELETELLGLAGHIAAAQCRFLRLLAEFDRRDGWAGPGLCSCAHWLSWRAGMSLRTAAEHVRVAHALERLPRIAEAFAAGRISYSKVRAITRITGTDPVSLAGIAAAAAAAGSGSGADAAPAPPRPDAADHPCDPADPGTPDPTDPTDLPRSTPDPGTADPAVADRVLLNLALSGTASHVETVVRAVRRRRTPPEDLAARRSLSWHWDENGSLVVRGRFTPDEGAALIAAVEALVPPRGPLRHPVPEPPEGWRERAAEQEPGLAEDRVGARRADALLALVTGGAGTGEGGTGEAGAGAAEEGAPVVARGRAEVVVHVDAGTGTARIAGGPELAPSTAERLACDARVRLLLGDRTNNRLYLGRTRRLASPAQIAALTVRDGARCLFAGCAHTRHLHAHHVVPWLRGGPTDVDNLVLVCSFHHRVIHDHGYLIRRQPGGWEFRRPDGSPVPGVGAPLTGNVDGLIEIDVRAGLRITRDTLTPTWAGERLDPAPILDALLPRPATRVA
jgi:hypothetical protein